ncbi:MAG: phosphoenolpyruvate synthase [Candidatus Levybacteria bacterium]|nr:phosphoenolpyruvate synthase [Candidatus Levybacteria bacterium]MBP9815436.1 phosphoenolpyruvate synthase [Candidatus Levybacteria bacterium]
MVTSHDLVVSLSDCTSQDVKYVGGKAANLGEMINASFPVPGGFVVSSNAYYLFLKENKLDVKIKHLLGSINFESTDSLSQVSHHIKQIILSSQIPEKIVKEVFSHYKKIGTQTLVAVRSSATSEDSKKASFAGQQETFLNVSGEALLMDKIREGWASLFSARAMFYRHDVHLDHFKTGIALAVQKMVQSTASGVMFSIDPVTNNKNKIIIESIYGLGEYIVQGKVTPDHYEVAKSDFLILEKKIVNQKIMYVKKGSDNKEEQVPKKLQDLQKITDDDITTLAKLSKKLEEHYFFPQDSEWAKENGKIYLVQTRPITTTVEVKKEDSSTQELTSSVGAHPIIVGDPASPGVGIGKVKIIHSLSDASSFEPGMVLVAKATNPDYVPIMKKAAAIVTAEGGRTSHAAIVSREYGLPAVVGAHFALTKLKEGMSVTVNGRTGEVFQGSLKIKEEASSEKVDIKTATKVYVNVGEPELAEKIASMHVDGVGLLRAEFMIAQIGIHPKKLIEDGKENIFIDRLSQDLMTFCKAFYPRPVLYRATDFKTNEYRNLKGGKAFEPEEPNPMLGYRGVYRYINDPRVFKLELAAIKRVREKMGFVNLRLMLPFVRSVSELESVKKLIFDAGLKRSHTFKLFMMVEIPANVILIDDFIDAGIDGVSIGSNDLTMLTLGVDRDNDEVATEFDERNKALLWSYERVLKAAREHGIDVGICGQAPSEFPDLVEKLVHWGVNSISVSPDAVLQTRRTIHASELKLLKRLKGQ